MADEQRDVEPAVDEQGYGNQLRRQAALARELAQTQREIADQLAALGEHGFDTTAMSHQAMRAAQGLEQIGSLHAETALAHDDMIAAGGPADSRAYVEYEATLRRHRTLWPGKDSFGT